MRHLRGVIRSGRRLALATAGLSAALGAGCSGDVETAELVGSEAQSAQVCVTLRRTTTPGAALDARIESGTPDTNYGTTSPLGVGPTTRYSLLQFDLSSIPAGVTLTSAQLAVQEIGATTGGLALHRVTAPWVESAVTWNSFAGAFHPTPVVGKQNPAGTQVLKWNALSLVQQWVSGLQPNYGFLIRQQTGTTDFGSSEGTPLSVRPRLVVCYNSATCTDGVQNQGETAIDCGGPCAPCAATCTDGIQNQAETGVDCGGPCAACPALGRAPYIQIVTPTSAVLAWTTNIGSTTKASYGASAGSLLQVASNASLVTQHEITLSGLTPDTRYYYSVGSVNGTLAGGDATHYFETAPVVGTKKKLRAWIVGDSGTGASRQIEVRDAMLGFAGAHRPDLFLHLGDMAYTSGTTSEFTTGFFTPYAAILENTVVWPTMGNHEGTSSDSGTQTGPYYTAYVLPKAGQAGGVASGTEAYYSFDYANIHFVVLDSHDSPRTTGGAMLQWMTADLAATSQDWLIAFFHHPPYTKGSHNSDTEGQLVEMRQNALPILEAAGVDLVLAGHSHIYERSFLIDGAYDTPTTLGSHLVDGGDGKTLGAGPYVKSAGLASHEGAVYVVAGHGGTGVSGPANHPVMFFSEVQNGSCLLDVQDNRLSVVNVRYDGVVTDQFSMVKGTGLVLAAPDGGETLGIGQTYVVKWATVGAIPSVMLEYSVDDGANWLPIATVANTGTYAWAVPAATSASALVRVSDAANPGQSDESNATFTLSQNAQITAIAFGDAWKYQDQGVDLGTAWLALGFDDASWAQGAAQLGYGDGDEATVLFKAPSPVYPSDYFRKVITVSGSVLDADLTVLHDDGYAVWVNGTLVASKNVGNGTGYAAYASAISSENELSTTAVSLSPSPFVNGSNIVAVMVKQGSSTSSDLSFDLKLDLLVGP